MLVMHYGGTRGAHLFGVWNLCQPMSRAEIAEHVGISRNVVSRHLAAIQKAGIPSAPLKNKYRCPRSGSP
jgi:predicted ArsR family transcriptional regulator